MRKIFRFFKSTLGMIILVVAAVAAAYHFIDPVQDFIGKKLFKKTTVDPAKPYNSKSNPWAPHK